MHPEHTSFNSHMNTTITKGIPYVSSIPKVIFDPGALERFDLLRFYLKIEG